MVIRNNIAGLRTYNSGRKTVGSLKKNLEKLSSGYRINRAADDAAGLGVSERILAKVTELDRCGDNATEGIDLARTADAALQEVNDMLKRARSLCIEAENGTYSDQELAAISDEMNHLFGEIDRISAGSYHNSICLFRNEVEPDFHYEYDEDFTPVGDDLQLWGELDYIEEGPFDRAEAAKAATATFKLDDDIDLNDVSTLNGRSIRISRGTSSYTETIYFTDGTVQPPSGTTSSTAISINNRTVQQVMSDFCYYAAAYSSSVASASFNAAERTITLTAPLRDLDKGTIEADGLTLPNKAPNGNGAWANGTVIATTPGGSASLDQVDGSGSTNNRPVYSDTATASISLSRLSNTLTPTQVDNLKGNSLSVGGHTIKLSDLNPSTSMTRDQFGAALATKISGFSNLSATYDSTSRSVQVIQSDLSTSSGYTSSISETKVYAQTHDENGVVNWTSRAANFAVNVTTPASGERPEVCEITVPSDLSSPFSFSLNGAKYLYYNSSTHPLMNSGETGTKYDGSTSSSNITRIPINSYSRENIIRDIANKIRSASGGTVVVNGDKLTVTAGNLNSSMNLAQNLRGVQIHVTSYNTVTDQKGTDYMFGSGTAGTFYKTAEVPFHLGGSLDVDKLTGSGFTIGGYRYEFTKGAGVSNEHTDIDISSCTTFSQLKDRVQASLPNTYTVELDDSDANDIKLKIKISNVISTITVVDGSTGVKGLIGGSGSVSYSGGVDTGHSQKAIDFSSINEENLDTLLGKGFRINCATCEGEYINVIFCWTRNPDMPAQFQRLDEGTGEMRTIHNIPVELSKITSADKIVENIVEQVRPQLKHFTDVAVGGSPTTLLAMEKRIGDVNVNNSLKLGSVETGVETNFVYSVAMKKVIDPPEPRTLKESEVNIYVGSDPEPQIIPIHLPYIDLKQLRLRPPELVDLTAEDQDPADWLQRVDDADIAISSARGTIGADYNRLEHSIQDLSNTHIQLSDAYSVIRDTDMADLMMQQVKDQILIQAQQSMQAQANQMPQGVLQLMQ